MLPDQHAQGIDVSHWQGSINWPAVKAAGVLFAIIKATESTNIVDSRFAANWAAAKTSGLLRSAYHFFRPNVDPKRQAAHFVKAVPWESGDMPLVLDVETDGGLDKTRLVNSLTTCLTEIERLTEIRPILYTAPYFWNSRVAYPSAPDWTSQYPLWIANYTTAAQPMIPKGWTAWTFWQYTDRGSVGGVAGNVDRNHFNGSEAALRQWVKDNTGAETPPEASPETLIQSYFAALNGQDLPALMGLYRSNAALVTAAQTISGAAAIRQWFQSLLTDKLANGNFQLGGVEPAGTSWNFRWTCASDTGNVLDGQDTIGLLDGKIAYHTTTFTIAAN